MANHSSSGLIRRRGFDRRGRTGYQIGEKTLLTEQEQYDAAAAAGFTPPTPGGGSLQPELISAHAFAQARGARAQGINAYGLYSHHSARDPLAYEGRVAPSNGAEVRFLRARSGLLTHMVPRPDRSNPTFAANADGNGRAGLRFTAANTQAMEWPGVVPLQNADAAFTIFAMFRTAATPGGRQTLLSINRDGAANAMRECIRIDVTATGFGVVSGNNGSATDDSINAYVSQVPAAGETYIVVGRHGTNAASDAFNKIDVRKGGTTTTVTNGNAVTLNFASTAALQQGVIGGYRRGGWSQHFDGWLLDWGWYPSKLDDTQTAALIEYLRLEGGVS